MRLQYPSEIEIIMVPGTGREDILDLLKALENGADAVLVAGCLEGECHYLTGNIQAKKRVHKLKKDLSQMGLEPERLEMFNLSSSDGPRWAAICQEMSQRAHRLGPSPVKRQARATWVAMATRQADVQNQVVPDTQSK
jgi:F420-non-reducing hydrogenase iron-sulfur subunit